MPESGDQYQDDAIARMGRRIDSLTRRLTTRSTARRSSSLRGNSLFRPTAEVHPPEQSSAPVNTLDGVQHRYDSMQDAMKLIEISRKGPVSEFQSSPARKPVVQRYSGHIPQPQCAAIYTIEPTPDTTFPPDFDNGTDASYKAAQKLLKQKAVSISKSTRSSRSTESNAYRHSIAGSSQRSTYELVDETRLSLWPAPLNIVKQKPAANDSRTPSPPAPSPLPNVDHYRNKPLPPTSSSNVDDYRNKPLPPTPSPSPNADHYKNKPLPPTPSQAKHHSARMVAKSNSVRSKPGELLGVSEGRLERYREKRTRVEKAKRAVDEGKFGSGEGCVGGGVLLPDERSEVAEYLLRRQRDQQRQAEELAKSQRRRATSKVGETLKRVASAARRKRRDTQS